MKNNFDFIDFYYDCYKEIMDEYYSIYNDALRKNVKNAVIIAAILIVIPITLIFFTLGKLITGTSLFWIIFIYIVIVFIYVGMGLKQTADKELRVMKSKIIDDILTFISKDGECEYLPRSRVSKDSFEKTNLFKMDLVNYNGSNYIKSKYNNATLIFADIEIYIYTDKTRKSYYTVSGKSYVKTYKEKVKDIIFQGSYFGAELNKNNDTIIYLIPNTTNKFFSFNKLKNYVNYDGKLVNLENIDFSKKYRVYSTDETKARYILTLPVMEKINELDKLFPSKKFIVFKNDGRFSVFIENYTIENIKDMPLSIIRNFDKEIVNLGNMFDRINNYFLIYDILDLEKDIYKKKSH